MFGCYNLAAFWNSDEALRISYVAICLLPIDFLTLMAYLACWPSISHSYMPSASPPLPKSFPRLILIEVQIYWNWEFMTWVSSFSFITSHIISDLDIFEISLEKDNDSENELL